MALRTKWCEMVIATILISLFLSVSVPAQERGAFRPENSSNVTSSLLNINDLSIWVRADGVSALNPYYGTQDALPWGIVYPRGVPAGLVWADGFIWAGFVVDGTEPLLRAGGYHWQTGLQPGAILGAGVAENPNDMQANRVWRYRPDWQTADLTDEAFDVLVSKPNAAARDYQFSATELQAVADSLRQAYEFDFNNWPWQKGAPFHEENNNGIMDAGETPGLLNADQVLWFVANDLNPDLTLALYGSPPIGIEMQVTLWAFRDRTELDNTVFRRVRLIYKGTAITPTNAMIDNMGVSIYGEVDIGNFSDDFAGTDTTLQTVFAYNATALDDAYRDYLPTTPAVGYTLLQGPIIPSMNPHDSGMFDFKERFSFNNLPLTGSWINIAGDTDSNPTTGSYSGTLQYYNVVNGFRPRPESPPDPFLDPTGKVTRFSRTGDPLTGTGWLDANPGDRQFDMTIANFQMALGDTQEVIFATTADMGKDNLLSVAEVKRTIQHVLSIWGAAFAVEPPTLTVAPDYSDKNLTQFEIAVYVPNAEKVLAQVADHTGKIIETFPLLEEGGDRFANTWTTEPRENGLSFGVKTITHSDTLTWPRLQQQIPTFGEIEALQLLVVSDNINSDGKINPGENIRVTARLGNASLQPVAGLKILISTDDEWVKTKDAQQALGVLPAADTVAVSYDAQDAETFSSFEVLPGAPEDHIIHFEVTLYDTSFNLWQNEVSMQIDAFAAEPEMQLIEHIEGPASGTFGIYIVDPAALTGDSYRITINSETGEIEDRTLNLFNISTGDTVLQNHPLPDEFGHNMPVMDGFKLTRGTLDFHGGIDQFLEVRFNGQPVEPPQPVWQQANSNGSYALSEPPPSGLRSNVSALKDHDVEIRFTNDGGLGWYSFESGNAVGVPFELWDTGTATPDDSTDDVRLIPILFSNGGSLDVFDIDSLSLDSFYGLPSSDRIYFYDGDYEAFEDMAKGGNVTQDFTREEYIGRLLIVDLDQNGQLPPMGTTIRITTFKPPTVFDIFEFTPVYTDVALDPGSQLPKTFALYQNYPNPFNPATTIRYDLPVKSDVTLSVFNVLGQEVLRLVDKAQPAGRYAVQWDGRNRAGVGVSSGVYFFKLKTDRFTRVNKMLLVR